MLWIVTPHHCGDIVFACLFPCIDLAVGRISAGCTHSRLRRGILRCLLHVPRRNASAVVMHTDATKESALCRSRPQQGNSNVHGWRWVVRHHHCRQQTTIRFLRVTPVPEFRHPRSTASRSHTWGNAPRRRVAAVARSASVLRSPPFALLVARRETRTTPAKQEAIPPFEFRRGGTRTYNLGLHSIALVTA